MKGELQDELHPTRRFSRLYIVALSAIALFALAGQGVIQYSLLQQSSDALIINTAGRQRYLSLKLTMAVCGLIIPSDPFNQPERAKEVQATLTAFIHERHGLMYGDPSLDLPGNNSTTVMQLLTSIEPNFEAISSASTDIINKINQDNAAGVRAPATELTPDVDIVLAQEEGFATTMNTAVAQFQLEAQDRVTHLRIIEIVLCCLTLAVLLLEGIFVFHPAVNKLNNSITAVIQAEEQVVAHAEELEHKNGELELAFEEAMAAHRKVMPHARVIAVGRYQVMSSRGNYFDVESKQVNDTMILECQCPMYKRNMICSHSLAAGSLHTALLRQKQTHPAQSPAPINFPPQNQKRQKEG
ncbi:MAG TPA: type IV pili methyl-accepting chemotaxis transducer N-terminal domain-containing protein [Ktedonobacteraceae bacterium]